MINKNDIRVKILLDNGFGNWNGKGLLLFPGKLFNKIPEGLEVVDIFNKREVFNKKTSDDDTRYGCLAYGIKEDKYQYIIDLFNLKENS